MRPAASFPLSSRQPSLQQGLTLIELIAAIAVLAIIATIGVPSFQRFTARNEVAAEVMRIKTALALARNTAVTRRTTISVCSSPGPNHDTCTFDDWSHPWVIVEGEASGGNLIGNSVLRILDGPTKAVKFNRNDRPVRFSALGRSHGHNGTFIICIERDAVAKVIISNAGRVRIGDNTTPQSC
ncbi:type IV fimbrial biogenesis protein FimT [Halomonas ventosae]|uniref:Type II secretion system protein H n=1 Tax=Halomonas ventosae TaxID=229007 RepID=A0A4V3DPB0_9GAMM|nr:GspH/FimT family pseudopilin [Halomonas ventosae]TDR51606.1 type IV fimbrial biogenesis protein FimT [Halomonas ventosae]